MFLEKKIDFQPLGRNFRLCETLINTAVVRCGPSYFHRLFVSVFITHLNANNFFYCWRCRLGPWERMTYRCNINSEDHKLLPDFFSRSKHFVYQLMHLIKPQDERILFIEDLIFLSLLTEDFLEQKKGGRDTGGHPDWV